MEGYILEGNQSADVFEWLRIRGILDFRLCLHHGKEPFESGEAFLNHFRKLHQNLNRADENSDIQCIHGKICRLHFSFCDQVAAEYQCDKIHHSLEKQVIAHKTAHAFVVGILGEQKIVIALAEFFFFHILVCERLNHADSGEGVLQTGIDISDFLPVFHKGRLHSAVLAHRKCKHAKHQKQKWNCQLPVDQEEEDERSDDLDHGNKQILRSMMRKFCNIKQVRDKFAHHLSGVVLIIIRKRKFFIVVKKLLTHIPFHISTHHMPLIADIIFAQALDQVHDQKTGCNGKQCA